MKKIKMVMLLKFYVIILPNTKSGTPGSDSVKVKGNIHWVSTKYALDAEAYLFMIGYFKSEQPGFGHQKIISMTY